MSSSGKAAAARRAIAIGAAVTLSLAATLPPILAADVNITANTPGGIDLDTYVGSTVDIATGVTVGTGIGSTGTWAVTNNGTVNGTTRLRGAGSSVTNTGFMSGANTITLDAGGTVINALGATLSANGSAINIGKFPSGGNPGVGPGVVTNSGTIASVGVGGDLVLLQFGGTVTNTATGTITVTSSGNAVSVGQGTNREVYNYGSIINLGQGGNSTGVFVQGGPSVIYNGVNAVMRGGFNGVYASATGVLTFENHGLIESTGASANSKAVEATGGGTFINTGMIRSISGDGLFAGLDSTITNSGTITGAVNAINYSGTCRISDNNPATNPDPVRPCVRTLKLDTGSVLNGLVRGNTGTENLVLLGTGTEDASKFLNFETLSMQGEAWTLTGLGTFATSGEVQAGILDLTGTITTPTFDVRTNGTLRGTGTVVGALSNAGTVDLTAGTLNVTGTFANATGSLFRVGVSTGGAAGLLDVSGAATLSGGTVGVVVASGAYAVGDAFQILDAGSITGDFVGVIDDSPFLQFVLDDSIAGQVWIRITDIANLPEGAETPNQLAAAVALQDIGAGDAFDAASLLMTDEALEAFDELSGEIHAAVLTSLASASRYPREVALDRIEAGLGSDQPVEGARNIWVRAYGGRGTVEGDGNAAAMDFGAGGLLFGADGLIAPDVFAGILAGFGGQNVDIPERASDAEIHSYHLGLYGGAAIGQVRLAAGAAVSAHDVSVTRNPEFTGFSDELESSYGVTTGQLFGELGYAFDLGQAELVPFVRAAVIGQSGGDYSETGGDAALSGSSDALGSTVFTVGLKAATDIAIGEGKSLTAHGLVALQHSSGDAPTATHAFPGGTPFTVSGADPDDTALLLEAGIGGELAPGLNLDLGYRGAFGSASSNHGVKLTLSGQF